MLVGRHRPAVALPDGAVDVAVVADDAKVDVRDVHGLRGRHVLAESRLRLVKIWHFLSTFSKE